MARLPCVRGAAGPGAARQGAARLGRARRDAAPHDSPYLGLARLPFEHGEAGHVSARPGLARHGAFGHDQARHGGAPLGMAWLGWAWRCWAGLGPARRGRARLMVSWLENDPRPTMTDCDFLAAVLADGRAHTTSEILQASFKERGCGMTVHSRASDLRKRGVNVECRCVGRVHGRALYEYQFVAALPEPSQSSAQFGEPKHAWDNGGAGREGSGSAAPSSGTELSPLSSVPEQISLELPHRWEPAA